MDENEKKLIQAQHRLEEAQARDRVKERKARTRVIQKTNTKKQKSKGTAVVKAILLFFVQKSSKRKSLFAFLPLA